MDPGQGSSTLSNRSRRFFVPLMVLLALSLILQVIGFATPGWFILKAGSYEVAAGLWSIKMCVGKQCETVENFNMGNTFVGGMSEFRGETIVALALIFIAMIIVGLSQRTVRTPTPFYLAILLTLGSCVLAMVAAGTGLQCTTDFSPLLELGVKVGFPYSLLLTGLGGIFAAIATLLILVGVRPWKAETAVVYQVMQNQQVLGPIPSQPDQPYLVQQYFDDPNSANSDEQLLTA